MENITASPGWVVVRVITIVDVGRQSRLASVEPARQHPHKVARIIHASASTWLAARSLTGGTCRRQRRHLFVRETFCIRQVHFAALTLALRWRRLGRRPYLRWA